MKTLIGAALVVLLGLWALGQTRLNSHSTLSEYSDLNISGLRPGLTRAECLKEWGAPSSAGNLTLEWGPHQKVLLNRAGTVVSVQGPTLQEGPDRILTVGDSLETVRNRLGELDSSPNRDLLVFTAAGRAYQVTANSDGRVVTDLAITSLRSR